jgi:hypothetical protein
MGQGQFGMTGGSGFGFNLDWEQCKELFGWGSSGKGYVLVMDYEGIIDQTNCKAVIDKLTADKNVKYAYVRNLKGTDTCCSQSKCVFSDFEKLMETAVKESNLRRIDLIVANTKQDLEKYGITNIEIARGDGGSVLYGGDPQRLFGRGVAFSAAATKAPSGQRAATSYQVVGVADRSALPGLKAEIVSWITETSGLNRVAYVMADEAARSIVLTDNIDAEAKKIADGAVYLKGTETGIREAMLSPSDMAPGTILYVLADGLSMPNPQTTAQKVAKSMSSQPTFEKAPKISYCKDGNTLENPWGSNAVLLRASYDAYVVSLKPTDACTLTTNRLTFKPGSLEAAQRLAYARKAGEGAYLLLTGSQGFREAAIELFISEKANLDAEGKILTPGEDWAILPAKKLEGQACGVDSAQRNARKEALALQVADSKLPLQDAQKGKEKSVFILDCAYGGEPGEEPATLKGNVGGPQGSSYASSDISHLTIHINKKDSSKLGDYTESLSDVDVALEGGGFKFTIRNLGPGIGEGDYPLWVWATWHNTATGICHTSQQVSLGRFQLVPGADNALPNNLNLGATQGCVKSTAQKYTYTITDLALVDVLGNYLHIPGSLKFEYSSDGLRTETVSLDSPGYLRSKAIESYEGSILTINSHNLQNDLVSEPLEIKLNGGTSSSAGQLGSTTVAQQDLAGKNLKISNALKIGLDITLTKKGGGTVTEGFIGAGSAARAFSASGRPGSASASSTYSLHKSPVANGKAKFADVVRLGTNNELRYYKDATDTTGVELYLGDCDTPAPQFSASFANNQASLSIGGTPINLNKQDDHAVGSLELCVDTSKTPGATGGAAGEQIPADVGWSVNPTSPTILKPFTLTVKHPYSLVLSGLDNCSSETLVASRSYSITCNLPTTLNAKIMLNAVEKFSRIIDVSGYASGSQIFSGTFTLSEGSSQDITGLKWSSIRVTSVNVLFRKSVDFEIKTWNANWGIYNLEQLNVIEGASGSKDIDNYRFLITNVKTVSSDQATFTITVTKL